MTMITARKRTPLMSSAVDVMRLPLLLLVVDIVGVVFVSAQQQQTANNPNDILYQTDQFTLLQSHVIARHGARLPLQKHPTNLGDAPTGGSGAQRQQQPTLTWLGHEQMYELGQWIDTRYEFLSDDASIELQSTAFDRTITSTASFLQGLLEVKQQFQQMTYESPGTTGTTAFDTLTTEMADYPIYTEKPDNDIVLRAYDKCPKFHSRLVAGLYKSQEWQLLSQTYAPLLQKLATFDALKPYYDDDGSDDSSTTTAIQLQDLWNIYDIIHVVKTECDPVLQQRIPSEGNVCGGSGSSSRGSLDPTLATILTDDEWRSLERLTHQTELLKYGRTSTTGQLLGGNLIQTILSKMRSVKPSAAAGGGGTTAVKSLSFYGTHYPTLLGVLAALGHDLHLEDSSTAGTTNDIPRVIPDYAAAIVIELYMDNTSRQLLIQVLYKPNNNEAAGTGGADEYVLIRPRALSGCATQTICTVQAYDQLFSPRSTAQYQKQWCAKCQNKRADLCVSHELAIATINNPTPNGRDRGGDNDVDDVGHPRDFDPNYGYGRTSGSSSIAGSGNMRYPVLVGYVSGLATILMLWIGYRVYQCCWSGGRHCCDDGQQQQDNPPMKSTETTMNDDGHHRVDRPAGDIMTNEHINNHDGSRQIRQGNETTATQHQHPEQRMDAVGEDDEEGLSTIFT